MSVNYGAVLFGVGTDVNGFWCGGAMRAGVTSTSGCWYCQQRLFSLGDNGNPNPAASESLWGYAPAGCFGYSHARGERDIAFGGGPAHENSDLHGSVRRES